MINEIDYSQIDPLCIDMVKFFNQQGLPTKFSCQGHEDKGEKWQTYEIMFADVVNDYMITDFIAKFSNEYGHSPICGKFLKWARKMNERIQFNWIYQVSYSNASLNQKLAKEDLKILQYLSK